MPLPPLADMPPRLLLLSGVADDAADALRFDAALIYADGCYAVDASVMLLRYTLMP